MALFSNASSSNTYFVSVGLCSICVVPGVMALANADFCGFTLNNYWTEQSAVLSTHTQSRPTCLLFFEHVWSICWRDWWHQCELFVIHNDSSLKQQQSPNLVFFFFNTTSRTQTLSVPFMIFDPIASAESKLMSSLSLAVRPDVRLRNFTFDTSNGSFVSNHSISFYRSRQSRLERELPISACCSLELCGRPVRDVTAWWIMAHRCIQCIHVSRKDSVTPRPCVSPPRPFIVLIITCSIIRSVHRPAQKRSERLTVKTH